MKIRGDVESINLPRCHHNNCLMDNAGERLEPPCGCRYGFASVVSKLTCRWCNDPIYEGIPEGKRRVYGHVSTKSRYCGGAWGENAVHIAFPKSKPSRLHNWLNDNDGAHHTGSGG